MSPTEGGGQTPPKKKRAYTKRRPKFTEDKIEKAIRATAGIYKYAAQRLKCSPTTVKSYVVASERLTKARDEALDEILDLTEHKLFQKVRAGNVACMLFLLKCKAKDRGYVERQEVTGAAGGPLSYTLTELDELKKNAEQNEE